MDINCRKLNCKHNKKCVCTAKGIKIDNETTCKTYILDSNKKVEDLSKTMFSKTPDYENFRHIKDADIECNAHCIFNKKGKCLANGIIILDNKKAICGTFIQKTKNKQV